MESKSSDTDVVPEDDDDAAVSAGFVRRLLEEHSTRVSAQLDAGWRSARGQLQSSLDQNLAVTLGQLDTAYQRRFASLERGAELQERKVASLNAELLVVSERLGKLEGCGNPWPLCVFVC